MRNLSSITMDGLHSILWTVDFLKDCPRRTSGREKKSLCRQCWRMTLNISRSMSLQRMRGERNYSKKRKSGFWTRTAIGSILLRISVRSYGYILITYVRGLCAGKKQGSTVLLFRHIMEVAQ